MEKLKNFFYSSTDSITPFPTLKPGTLTYCIANVVTLLDELDSPLFSVSIQKFQNFIASEYASHKEIGEEQRFLDDLFVSTSFQNHSQNALACLVLLHAITVVDLGSDISKATRIVKELNSLPSSSNSAFFAYLEKLLIWISKIFKSSMSFVLQPIVESIWQWAESREEHRVVSSFLLLSLLLRSFSFCLKSSSKKIVEELILSTQYESMFVISTATKCFDLLYSSNEMWIQDIALDFLGYFQIALENSQDYCLINFYYIIKRCLEDKKLSMQQLIVKELPFRFIDQKGDSSKKAFLYTVLICAESSPSIFTSEVYSQIFRTISVFLKKASSYRLSSFYTLGKLVIRRRGKFVEDERSILTSIKKSFFSRIDSPEMVFAYISLLTLDYIAFPKDILLISSNNISDLMVDGFYGYCLAFPNNKSSVFKVLIPIINSVLLALSYDGANYANFLNSAFRALDIFCIPRNLITVQLALQYSLHMNCPNLSVRESCFNFFVRYHNESPCVDTAQRLLVAISMEQNDGLRIYVLKQMKKEPIHIDLFTVLNSAIRDSNLEIRKELFVFFSRFDTIPQSQIVLNDFLQELVDDINDSLIPPKSNVLTFLHIYNSQCLSKYINLIMVPFAPYLICKLISDDCPISSSYLLLLSKILQFAPERIDFNLLSSKINNALSLTHTKKKIEAALDLLYESLNYPEMYDNLVSNQVVKRLTQLSHLSDSQVSHSKIIAIYLKLGTIDPCKDSLSNILLTDNGKEQCEWSTLFYLSQSHSSDPYNSLINTADSVCISVVLDILVDEDFSALHSLVISILISIIKVYKKIDLKLEALLLRRFTFLLINGSISVLSTIVSNIVSFIHLMGKRLTCLIPTFIEIVFREWGRIDSLQLIKMCESLMIFFPDEFGEFLSEITELFFSGLFSQDSKFVESLLSTYIEFGSTIRSISHIIYPHLLEWINYNANNTIGCSDVLQKMKVIVINCGSSKFYGQIFQTLIRIVQLNHNLHEKALNVILAIALNMESNFVLFMPMLSEYFNLSANPFMIQLISFYETGCSVPDDLKIMGKPKERQKEYRERMLSLTQEQTKEKDIPIIMIPNVNYDDLQWTTWGESVFLQLIKSSPSLSVSFCEVLLDRYSTLRSILFPVAFSLIYCKDSINDDKRLALDNSIHIFFESSKPPLSLCKYFLEIIEIFDLIKINHGINPRTIARFAFMTNNFPLGIRYLEKVFEKGDYSITKELVSRNQALHLNYSAFGAYMTAKKFGKIDEDPKIYESLGMWEESLELYWDLLKTSISDEFFDGYMKSLYSLLWLKRLFNEFESKPSVYRVYAQWKLFEKDEFMKNVELLNDNSSESLYYRAISCFIKGLPSEALEILNRIKVSLNDYAFPSFSDDFQKLNFDFNMISKIYDLEEVIKYHNLASLLKSANTPQKDLYGFQMDCIRKVWKNRLNFIPKDPSFLIDRVAIHSLVLKYDEMKEEWDNFFQCCFKYELPYLAESALDFLLKQDPDNSLLNYYRVVILRDKFDLKPYFKYLESIDRVPLDFSQKSSILFEGGFWMLNHGFPFQSFNFIEKFRSNNQNENESCLLWARINSYMYQSSKKSIYIENKLEALLYCVSRCDTPNISNILQILTILFHQYTPGMSGIFLKHFQTIPTSFWVNIIPQVIHHFDIVTPEIIHIAEEIIFSVFHKHPYPVLYSVQSIFNNQSHKYFIEKFKKEALKHYRIPFHDFQTFIGEIITISVFLWEQCYMIIQASILYHEKNEYDSMVKKLLSIDHIIRSNPKSFIDISFLNDFGDSLYGLMLLVKSYESSGEFFIIDSIYTKLFELKSVFEEMYFDIETLPLSDVSSVLEYLDNPKVTLPGKYDPNRDPVFIQKVLPQIKILSPEKRSKFIEILSNDGIKHSYLLKSHENMNIDERVMLLYAFINSIISKSSIPFESEIVLETYPVVQLSKDIEIKGWIDDCRSLDSVICDYRRKQRIDQNAEKNHALRLNPNYYSLPIIERANIFIESLKITDGNDIKNYLISISHNSADWLAKRIRYILSTSLYSVVGNIIGLRNRSLSNVLINNYTGRLIHLNHQTLINMNDEPIPFRLTRIFIHAFELSSVEGTYTKTCENIIDLIKRHQEQILDLIRDFPQHHSIIHTDPSPLSKFKNKINEMDGKYNVPNYIVQLINKATDPNNLCQMNDDWNPWW